MNRWSKVSIGAISMGQEIGVSAIQLAAMVSTFANDGVWVAPRLWLAKPRPRVRRRQLHSIQKTRGA